MTRGPNLWWLGLIVITLLLSGCSGVLHEAKYEDGRIERLKIDQGESWSAYDDKPRKPDSQSKKDKDDMSIMLKKEATF